MTSSSSPPAPSDTKGRSVPPTTSSGDADTDKLLGFKPKDPASPVPTIAEAAATDAPGVDDAAADVAKETDNNHLLAHSPAKAGCDSCMAKRRASPHRGSFEKPEEVGHYTADFKIIVGQGSDDKQILVVRDRYSDLFCAYPQKTRSAEETISSLLQLSPLKSLVADGEFSRIAKRMGIRHTPSIAHDHLGS